MSKSDDISNLLTRFLSNQTDARLIAHYLALLGEKEAQLKDELQRTKEETHQQVQTARKQSLGAPDTSPLQPNIESSPGYPATVSNSIDFDSIEHAKQILNKAAVELYNRGLKYFNESNRSQAGLDKAIDMFKQALDLNHPEAEAMLGNCYYYSTDKPNHLREALVWFTRAAQKGHPDAGYSVGYMHYHGEGTRVDKSIAIDYLNKSAAAGSAHARNLLIKLSSHIYSS